MLNSDFNHLSVWEIAHRWHDTDPNLTDSNKLPLAIQDSLRMMTKALQAGDISVCNHHGTQKKNPNEHPSIENYVADGEYLYEEFIDTDANGKEFTNTRAIPNPDFTMTEDDKRDDFTDFVERWCAPHYRLCEDLDRCYKGRCYDREKLESVHINQKNLVTLCRAKRLPLPNFWFNDGERQAFDAGLGSNESDSGNPTHSDSPSTTLTPIEANTQPIIDDFWTRLNSKQKHRLMCREIADELWRTDQGLTIAAMSQHEGILQYGGARFYTGINTIRDWIKDVPNRPKDLKAGRPSKQ